MKHQATSVPRRKSQRQANKTGNVRHITYVGAGDHGGVKVSHGPIKFYRHANMIKTQKNGIISDKESNGPRAGSRISKKVFHDLTNFSHLKNGSDLSKSSIKINSVFSKKTQKISKSVNVEYSCRKLEPKCHQPDSDQYVCEVQQIFKTINGQCTSSKTQQRPQSWSTSPLVRRTSKRCRERKENVGSEFRSKMQIFCDKNVETDKEEGTENKIQQKSNKWRVLSPVQKTFQHYAERKESVELKPGNSTQSLYGKQNLKVGKKENANGKTFQISQRWDSSLFPKKTSSQLVKNEKKVESYISVYDFIPEEMEENIKLKKKQRQKIQRKNKKTKKTTQGSGKASVPILCSTVDAPTVIAKPTPKQELASSLSGSGKSYFPCASFYAERKPAPNSVEGVQTREKGFTNLNVNKMGTCLGKRGNSGDVNTNILEEKAFDTKSSFILCVNDGKSSSPLVTPIVPKHVSKYSQKSSTPRPSLESSSESASGVVNNSLKSGQDIAECFGFNEEHSLHLSPVKKNSVGTQIELTTSKSSLISSDISTEVLPGPTRFSPPKFRGFMSHSYWQLGNQTSYTIRQEKTTTVSSQLQLKVPDLDEPPSKKQKPQQPKTKKLKTVKESKWKKKQHSDEEYYTRIKPEQLPLRKQSQRNACPSNWKIVEDKYSDSNQEEEDLEVKQQEIGNNGETMPQNKNKEEDKLLDHWVCHMNSHHSEIYSFELNVE